MYLYFFVELIAFIFKIQVLVYPTSSVEIEITSIVFILIIMVSKYYIGNIGNLTETSQFILFFLVLTFFTLFSFIYYAFLQTYILRIELIFNCIGIILNIIEIIGGLFAFLKILDSENSL